MLKLGVMVRVLSLEDWMVITWEFNRDNEVMDVRVQKNYGP